MLEVFINFICSLMTASYGFYIIKKIINSSEKEFTVKNIVLILILTITGIFIHGTKYSGLASITAFALNILIYKLIFKINIEESLIASGILMFLMFTGELLLTPIVRLFYSTEELRNTWYLYFLTNSLVWIIGIIIVNINAILKQFQKFYFSISKKKVVSNILYLILLVVGLSALSQNITETITININFLINLLTITIFIIITYLFIKSKNSYNELSMEYDNLFVYVQNFEDWIEKEQCNRHEYKNQLAVLHCLTNEKKVKQKIDEILEDNINLEGDIVHQLKTLPKGGIKGLMYYKAVIAQKQKINLTFNISIERKSILNKLTEKEMRTLCKLIGIYFDNAIEAAKETKKKIVLVEVYELKDKVNFVFSNTFKKSKNFAERNKKGVTTKGENRGNGLYFASKLLSKNNWLSQKQEIIDKYYIQQLTVKNKDSLKS